MIDFRQDYILENKRVKLRPLMPEDFNHLVEFSESEPEIWKYSLIAADGKENLKKYLQSAVNGRREEKEYAFIVFDKQLNTYAGSTRFYDIQSKQQTLQLGFTWYGKQFQGTGINKNCKFLLLSFAFETLDIKRVEFRADAQNVRSINAMKSIGCTVEGILRSNSITPTGTRRDSIVLSILQEEWYAKVKEELRSKLEETDANH